MSSRAVLWVSERGRRPVEPEDASALAADRAFSRLCDAGYVSLQAGGSTQRLIGHKYVGRAWLDTRELQIREKVPGALLSLVGAATGAELRTARLDSPADDLDAVSRALLEVFVEAAGRYVGDRRAPRYEYALRESPVLQGSLRLAPTIRAWAAGRRGRFVFDAGRVVRDSPLDRLVLAALDEIDRTGPVMGVSPTTLYGARWLAGGLDEVRDDRYLATSRAAHLDTAQFYESAPAVDPADVDLARLASVALLHQGFALSQDASGDDVPRAWFIDLETLFERAVRGTLRALLADCGVSVDRGQARPRRLFTGGRDRSLVNPDLVLGQGSGDADPPWAVGDVKYKSLAIALGEAEDPEDVNPSVKRSKEKRPDLYQVLVHAAALGASRAFLVYAGDGVVEPRYLGSAATGSQTWAAQIRPTHLSQDLAAMLAAMGLHV